MQNVAPLTIHPLTRLFLGILLLLPTLLSAMTLVAGLGILFWLSLHHFPATIDLEYSSFNNYVALVYNHLQRQAVLNTGLVTIMTWLLGLPLALWLANLLADDWRGRVMLAVVTLVPIATPTALGAVAWRKFFDLLYPVDHFEYTLLALAVVQAWRVLPMMAVILWIGVNTSARPHRWTWINQRLFSRFSYPTIAIALLMSAFLTITNVSIGLLFTEGEALNHTTPLWGTWAFQLGYISGDFGQSAASLIGLVPLLALLVLPLPMLANRVQLSRPLDSPLKPSLEQENGMCMSVDRRGLRGLRGFSFGAVFFILFFLTPLIALFIQPASQGTDSNILLQLRYLITESSYRQWLTNTTLIRSGVGLMAILFGVPAGYSLARLWGPLGESAANLLLWTSLIAGPVAFIPLAWLSRYWIWIDPRWILIGFYGVSTVPVCAWFTMQALRHISLQAIQREPDIAQNQWRIPVSIIWPSIKFGLLLVLIVSFGLAVQEFTTAFVLGGTVQQQTLSVGVVTQFAYHPSLAPTLLALTICFPTALGIFICAFIARSFLRTIQGDQNRFSKKNSIFSTRTC